MKLSKGLLAFALAAPALAQNQQEQLPSEAPNLNQLINEWQGAHGDAWRMLPDARTQRAEMIYGGSAAPVVQPATSDNSAWFNLTRFWVEQTVSMHGAKSGELRNERVAYLPLGLANGTDKMTVRLNQEVNGVPVENASINALYNTQGALLSIHNTTSPYTEGLSTDPTLSADAAVREATRLFRREIGLNGLDISEAELFIAQIEREGMRLPKLAYKVSVHRELQGMDPLGYGYVIDAHTGALLRRDDEIHYFDVEGTVKSLATPGTQADHGGNPEVEIPMGYIRLTSSAGTTFADRNGNFSFPGNSPLDITVTFDGTFNTVNNDAGADYSVTFNNVPANTPTDLVMNPNAQNLVTAQANSYEHIGQTRDMIKDTNPSDTTADFQAVSNANLAQTCNAFFNGGSVNYYQAGGGCNNTAFTTVVAHEYGHWLNVLYGTGNGSDGMGEGNADVFAMYTYDTPIVGEFFFTSGGAIRNGLGTRQFCGDNNSGCHGGVHANGEVWMGAAWKVRRNLKQTLGNGLGIETSNQLFIGWMNSFNQTEIKSIIEAQWLTLDDDDGNINNGTPNYQDIDDGFTEQGFPGFDLPFVVVENVSEIMDQPSGAGPFTVTADVTAQFAPPAVNVELNYSLNGAAFQSVPMTSTGGVGFTGDIPSFGSQNGFVEWFLSAEDGNGETGGFGDAGDPLEFSVGKIVVQAFDFENGAAGWAVGNPNDATTGNWVIGNPNPTAAQSGDDHTPGAGNVNMWFTGNAANGAGLGENDVDGGTTSLISPALALAAVDTPSISYWRWYSNNQGGSANQDILQVDISNDDGATWVTAEVVGPAGDESNGGFFQATIVVSDFVLPTDQVRLRVRASDLGGGSIVEAGLDDVEVFGFGDACTPVTNYCSSTPNSSGQAAVMFFNGSQNADDNNVTLTVAGAAPNQSGLFYYGDAAANTPFGNGIRCVGGNFYRLFPGQVDSFGIYTQSLDTQNPPFPAPPIMNGDTYYFSFWFRDTVGAGFDFADGIEVEFCD